MGAIESASRMWGKSLNPWNLERTTGGSSGFYIIISFLII